jgi:hypothetical protein
MRALLAPLLFLLPSQLAAQSLVTSEAPEKVSLTVYRAMGRGNQPINANWPQGYALITETRTVSIPAGESVVRFEGVSEGMFPESAIVTGLPKGVIEKNRDARLLSPSGLVDAYLKREVTLTRTNEKTGKITTQDATIVTGPGGIILKTEDGFEALRCTGLPERMTYPGVPANLSAKPTLSIITQSDTPVTAKLTLTYMAAGFDWQANYIAQVAKSDGMDKSKVDMFAWLTVANGGNQSFANANMMAIAGEPKRVARGAQPQPVGGGLALQCWPEETTDQVPYRLGYDQYGYGGGYPSPPPPSPVYAPAPMAEGMMDSVVVTARARKSAMPVAAIVAEQEDLGDLKLYRVPEPVTVNAKGQKQVAMIVKPGAKFDRIYKGDAEDNDGESAPMNISFIGDNLKEQGLGVPMPSGQVMIFEDSKMGPLLTAGRAGLKDRAVGDEVELFVGRSNDVRMAVSMDEAKGKSQRWTVKLTNARATPVRAEVKIPYETTGKVKGIAKKDGVPTWKGTVPANGEVSFGYSVKVE